MKYSGKYAQYMQRSFKTEGRKEKARNQRKRKKMQTPRATLLLKTAFVQSPHPLKVLFINAYNNSLEEKYKSAAEGGGVCLSKLRLQRWGTEGREGSICDGLSPPTPSISLLIISERNLSYCQCLRTLNIIRPTWRQIS